MKSKTFKLIEYALLIILFLFSIFISTTNVFSDKVQIWYWVIVIVGVSLSSIYHEVKGMRKQDRIWVHFIQFLCSCLLILMLLFYLLTNDFSIKAFGLIALLKQVLTLITQEKEKSPEY